MYFVGRRAHSPRSDKNAQTKSFHRSNRKDSMNFIEQPLLKAVPKVEHFILISIGRAVLASRRRLRQSIARQKTMLTCLAATRHKFALRSYPAKNGEEVPVVRATRDRTVEIHFPQARGSKLTSSSRD